MTRRIKAALLIFALSAVEGRAASTPSPTNTAAASEVRTVQILSRNFPLPDLMQGRWRDREDPHVELIVSGGEVTCFGKVVNYDVKEISEEDRALTVSLRVNDAKMEDTFARENITGLALTEDGVLHAWNVKFGSEFVRLGPAH